MKLSHRHIFVTSFVSRWGKVQSCLNCPYIQTTMMDYSKGQVVAIPGNFIYAGMNRKVFVVCGEGEFQKAQNILLAQGHNLLRENMIRLTNLKQLEKEILPAIFLWGNWQDNDFIDSPMFTTFLNGWL